MNIQEIRQQYPQYNDMPDESLARGLHGRFYSDMPYEEFSSRIGLAQVVQPDKRKELESTLAAQPTQVGWVENLGRGVVQGGKDVVMGALQTGADIAGAALPENKAIEEFRQLTPEAQARSNIQYQAATGDSTAAGIGRVGGQIAGYSVLPGGVVLQGAMAGAMQPTEEQRTPEQALTDRALGGTLGAAVGYVAPKIIAPVVKGAGAVAGKAAEKIGILAPKELPKELGTLEPLIKAGRQSILAKDPNALDLGLKANQTISANFDKAKALQSEAYKAAHESGKFEMKASSVYDKLNQLTKEYESKVAPGSKEQAAFNRLNDIKNELVTKYGKKNKVITPSDLMDIEQAISSGLPVNKFFKTGDTKLMDFKTNVNTLLERAGKENADFGVNYRSAKGLARDVARKYTKNDALKPIWQPEDHIAWKANQNNPDQLPFGNKTLSRAQQTLGKLNTQETGRIKAVMDILPKDQADELMRAAVIKARQDDISITSAFTSLMHGHPIVAATKAVKTFTGQGQKVNIDTVIEDLKRMKKRP